MDQAAPKAHSADAVRLFLESVEYDRQGDHLQAYQLLIASINDDPTLPGAWNNLGVVLSKLKHYTSSAAAFYRALELAPTALPSLASYAWTMHLSGRSEQALPVVQRVIQQDPSKPMHWTNLSQIQLALDNYAEALEAGQKAVSLAPDDIMARLALALAQLRSGDYQNGLREYEARFPYVLPHILKYPYPVWRGEDISKQRLFIPCEQGIGDSVMFMRFIPEAAKRARQVICYVHDNTVKLYRRNLPHNVEIHPLPRELPGADVFCPLLSLPVALGLSTEQIINSYYKYKYASVPIHAKDFPKDKLKIGICWAGDPKHDNDHFRSASLRDFLPLAELPDVQLYSFQVGARSADLDNFAAHSVVRNLAPQLRDTNDTCAILAEHMDIVVTVDTAFAHMAGSMGIKTYVLLGKSGVDWRWSIGMGPSLWYANTRMVRQGQSGDWASVISYVKKLITEER